MKAIESVAPLHLQEEYDNAGLQVGFADSPVRRVIVSLDITEEVVREAIRRDAQMIVSHHPLIFRPLRQVSNLSWQQRCVVLALQHGIALYSAHTNLDNARGGVNHEIARRLSLSFGVYANVIEYYEYPRDLMKASMKFLVENNKINRNDEVVILSQLGLQNGSTDMCTILQAKDFGF